MHWPHRCLHGATPRSLPPPVKLSFSVGVSRYVSPCLFLCPRFSFALSFSLRTAFGVTPLVCMPVIVCLCLSTSLSVQTRLSSTAENIPRLHPILHPYRSQQPGYCRGLCSPLAEASHQLQLFSTRRSTRLITVLCFKQSDSS